MPVLGKIRPKPLESCTTRSNQTEFGRNRKHKKMAGFAQSSPEFGRVRAKFDRSGSRFDQSRRMSAKSGPNRAKLGPSSSDLRRNLRDFGKTGPRTVWYKIDQVWADVAEIWDDCGQISAIPDNNICYKYGGRSGRCSHKLGRACPGRWRGRGLAELLPDGHPSAAGARLARVANRAGGAEAVLRLQSEHTTRALKRPQMPRCFVIMFFLRLDKPHVC